VYGVELSMTATSIRPTVEAFYKATVERDVETALSLIADDVDWLVQGPIDIFAFFGQRHGKAAVREGYAEIARLLDVTGFRVETLLVDGDRAAALIRFSAVVRATGNTMSVRTCQFSRYANRKLVEMRSIVDSYDLVEQAIGRPLEIVEAGAGLVPA
jgi:ketosteroid isomerase-like protein